MAVDPRAGKPAEARDLVDIAALVDAYTSLRPDASVVAQRVTFGTSGHRGSSLTRTFNEWHVLAISQAICEYRRQAGITGPLYIGIDTHALSVPAFRSALERVQEWQLARVAVPPLGLGAGNLGLEESATLMVEELLRRRAGFPTHLTVVAENDDEADALRLLLAPALKS